MTELLHSQSSLLKAIFFRNIHSPFNQKGLEAYQRNYQANAIRSLVISYPTTAKLTGEKLFNKLAGSYAKQFPPNVGDWAEWGADFAHWLKSRTICKTLLPLSDLAQLEWLQHNKERAENVAPDFDSFQQLAEEYAGAGHIVVNPTLSIERFDFSVHKVWQKRHLSEHELRMFIAVNHLSLPADQPVFLLVWRKQWQVMMKQVSEPERLWFEQLQQKCSLDSALEKMKKQITENQEAAFSFEHWLPEAITNHLIIGFHGNKENNP